VLLGAAALAGHAAPVLPAPPPDPSALAGTLPNGLRYELLPRNNEPGHVSLRLVVLAGSFDEREDERGYAHLVEHMAFAGSTHYPTGRLVEFMQTLGVGFGADLNADTSFTRTLYKLDLPAPGLLPQGLQVLRDYADGLTFPAAALDRQRGVVLSELRERDTGEYRFNQVWLATLYGATGLTRRMPIGLAERVRQADAGGLRAFYRRCYRPERMILIVAGDIDARAVAAAIRTGFGSMTSPRPRTAPLLPRLPPAPGRQFVAFGSGTVTSAIVDAVVVAPRPAGTYGELHAREMQAIALSLLGERLARRAQGDPRIGKAWAAVESGPDGRFNQGRVEVQCRPDQWKLAVALVETEIRRAQQRGFSAGEVQEAVLALEARLRGQRDQLATLAPAALADVVARALVSQERWDDPDAELQDALDFLGALTAPAVSDAFRAAWDERGQQIVLALPAAAKVEAKDLATAFRASAAVPLDRGARDDSPPLFHYGDRVPGGSVSARRPLADLGLDLVTFANGVKLNLRPSRGENKRFALVARVGSGTVDALRAKPQLEMVALGLLALSDLGRNRHEELGRILSLHAVTFNASLRLHQLYLTAGGPAAELPFALRFLTALLSDLQPQTTPLARADDEYANAARRQLQSVSGCAESYLYFRLTGDDPRNRFPRPADVRGYAFADVVGWMRRHWLEGPLELGITGDIDPESVVQAAAVTVGSLPPRLDPPAVPGDRLRPATQPFQASLVEDVADRAANLRIAWVIPVSADARARAALQLALDGMLDRLRRQFREALGATYTPGGAIFQEPDQPDFCTASIEMGLEPARAQALAAQALVMVERLAQEGMTEEEFTRLLEPRRNETAAQLGSDDWWLHHVLTVAQSQPSVLADVRTLAQAYAEITRAEVNRDASRYLPADAASTVLVLPKSAGLAP
jgi:zinc protease